MLSQFPFGIRGFHSDNGSEFINQTVAKLLNKLMIERCGLDAKRASGHGCGLFVGVAKEWNRTVADANLRYDYARSNEAARVDAIGRVHVRPSRYTVNSDVDKLNATVDHFDSFAGIVVYGCGERLAM